MGRRIWVDLDLDDVDTDDLIDELENRYLDEGERKLLLEMVKNNDDKINLFMKIKDRYSIFELEQMFAEQSESIPIPKNQLKLSI